MQYAVCMTYLSLTHDCNRFPFLALTKEKRRATTRGSHTEGSAQNENTRFAIVMRNNVIQWASFCYLKMGTESSLTYGWVFLRALISSSGSSVELFDD